MSAIRVSIALVVLLVTATVALSIQGEVSGIFDMIPADSPVFVVAPELGGLRANMQSFIGNFGMPQLPSDPIGLVLARMGVFSGLDNSKGMAIVILSEAATGVKLSRIMSMDNSGADEISLEDVPIVVIFGGSSVEEVFAVHYPVAEGENFVFLLHGKKTYARGVNGYIYMTPNLMALEAAVNATESVADKNDKSRLVAMSAMDIVFSLDTPAAMSLANAAAKKIEIEMAKELSVTPSSQLDQVTQGMKVIKSLTEACQKVSSQIETVDFGISFAGSGLKIDKYIKPMAGTDMANVLKVIKPSGADLLVGLPKGKHIMAFGFDVGDLLNTPAGKKATNDLARWSLSLVDDYTTNKARMDEFISDAHRVYGSSLKMSSTLMAVSAEQPVVMVWRTKVDDFPGAMDLLSSSHFLIASFLNIDSEGGSFKFSTNALQIDGISLNEGLIIHPEGFQGQTFGFDKHYSARLSNGDVVAVNAAPENIRLAIEGMSDGMLSEPAVMAAMNAMPEERFAIALFNAPEIFKFRLHAMQNADGMSQPVLEMFKKIAPVCKDLIVCGTAVEGKVLHGRVVVPVGIFQDVIKGRMVVQQQMMQGNQSDNLPPDSF